jgi:hypothetical protein
VGITGARRSILSAVLAGLVLVTSPIGPVQAADQVSLGRRFDDGLDTRLSALRLRDAAAVMGYAAAASTVGRSANDAWADGLGSAVFGLFGHANGGLFQLDEGPTDLEDPWLIAGRPADVLPPGSYTRAFSEYLPFADVDDMRLLVLAGCYTANPGINGDFITVAEAKGIDSVIAFPSLIYYPATEPGAAISTTDYAGNYFWGRFSSHAGTGVDVRTALSRARTDIVAKEGDGRGWDQFVVEGAVANPGGVRLAPAGNGQLLDSDPVPTAAFVSLAELTVTERATGEGPAGERLTTVSTADGVAYRTRSDGMLLDLAGTPSTEGSVTLSLPDAATIAHRFLAVHTGLRAAHLDLPEQGTTAHGDGEALARFTWRLPVEASGPARVDIEVDRRTGAVVYFAATRPATTAEPVGGPLIGAAAALDLVAAATELDGAALDVEWSVWDRPTWTVTVDRGLDGHVPDVDLFVVDAVTGEITARLTT